MNMAMWGCGRVGADEGSIMDLILGIPAYTIKMAGMRDLPDDCMKQIRFVLLTHMLCCSTNAHGHVGAWTGGHEEGSIMDVVLVIAAYAIRTASIHSLPNDYMTQSRCAQLLTCVLSCSANAHGHVGPWAGGRRGGQHYRRHPGHSSLHH